MESEIIDRTLVFHFARRLDALSATLQQHEIVDAIASHDKSLAVTFDFAGVEYISSGFIRILITVVRMKGRNFSIVNTSEAIRKTLVMASLDQLITLA
jgi:anti-anti-sigma factor